MTFLMRSTQAVPAEQLSTNKTSFGTHYTENHAVTLEGLIAKDSYTQGSLAENGGDTEAAGVGNESMAGESANSDFHVEGKHSDVTDKEGWIVIPHKELPDDWQDAPDIRSLKSLDRSFVFPGEQVHILACLSAYKQNTEIITQFKVAAMMDRNGKWKSPKTENGNMENRSNSVPRIGEVSSGQVINLNGEGTTIGIIDPQKEVFTGESLLRMEDQKRQTEVLLQRFEDSHFFVRIAEEGDPLWSKKGSSDKIPDSSEMVDLKTTGNEAQRNATDTSSFNAVIDQGNFDANVSGGLARNSAKCLSLSNGDLVVLLEVNIGVDCLKNPVIEILQFEKHPRRKLSAENRDNIGYPNVDPCGELLKWLLPLNNSILPPALPVSPHLSPSGGLNNPSHKPSLSASSSSQMFSFGNFRSYSMSSLPQIATPLPVTARTVISKPNIELDDWGQFSSQKFSKNQKGGTEEFLSFRGVSLERERFSVSCGLEGIYVPGRKWRKNLEIIQPLEIKSFAADCNTDDLLCVQIKNVSPPHTPDIVVYIDAITIVYEEASKAGPSSSLPVACIEAGIDHSLPNLPLRRGEEHSFILKAATSMWRNMKVDGERSSLASKPQAGNEASELHLSSKLLNGTRVASNTDQYSIMISCRCNYTESRLFFKKPTNWRPHISREFLISVASEMSSHSDEANGNVYQLPVQVLTLQASNLTTEDLTLTVLAPASVPSIPSVVSLNPPTSSSTNSFISYSDFTRRLGDEKHNTSTQKICSGPVISEKRKDNVRVSSVSFTDQASSSTAIISNPALNCTHLWLQSRVPLGCVPRQSTATIKLELLPLTDGIITLDTLQIYVKEKGITYIPEQSLNINATSSISSRILF